MAINVWFPETLQCLFWDKAPDGEPVRYRVLYGGRGGGKSWAIARALLVRGLDQPLRVLCARELQNSIKDSVHKVLSDQIIKLGLTGSYEILRDNIIGKRDFEGKRTEFSFEGIRHNINRIRSYEGVDVCWVEEAVNVSESSWTTLIPTIRKEGAEIWLSFNPELETDYTYRMFVKDPPPGAIVQEINWRDNPWFTKTLMREKDTLKLRDLDAYLNVWEGKCRSTLTGAVYAQELRDATIQKRLETDVPYDPSVPVDAFFDLGRADMTAIWIGQKVGFQFRLLRFYQNNQHSIAHYLKYLQQQEYVYGTLWLPHDAKAKVIGSELTIEEQVRKHGFRVRIVPRVSIADGINAARTIFPSCWFHPRDCEEGIQCLRHYRYDVDPDTKMFSKEPLHDQYSHGADAFRYLALALKEPKTARQVEALAKARGNPLWGGEFADALSAGLSWMRF